MNNVEMMETDPIAYAKIYMEYNRYEQAFEIIQENWKVISNDELKLNSVKEILKLILSNSKNKELLNSVNLMLNPQYKVVEKDTEFKTEESLKYKYMLSILMENDFKSYSYPTRVFVELNHPLDTQEGIDQVGDLYKNKNWALLSYVEIKR